MPRRFRRGLVSKEVKLPHLRANPVICNEAKPHTMVLARLFREQGADFWT